MITDPAAFYSKFIPGAIERIKSQPDACNKISRHLRAHLSALIGFEVLETAPQKLVMHAFTVSKKSGGLRFVLDGRPLNALMTHPFDMRLPPITDAIEQITSHSWAALADGKSWFYQFPVHPEIREYFGVNVGDRRGDYVRTRLKALCMGWSFAPCIAYRSARVLLPQEGGATWVDNFIVLGGSEEGVQRSFDAFLHRGAETNAVMNLDDPDYGHPVQRFTSFGIAFDMSNHRYRSDKSWLEKFLSGTELRAVIGGKPATPREIFKVVGGLVWHAYTTKAHLCFLPSTLNFMKDIAAASVDDRGAWDRQVAVRPSVRAEIKMRTHRMRANFWVLRPPTDAVTVWSDASSSRWGVLIDTAAPLVAYEDFQGPTSGHHIYLKEAHAARQAVRLTALHSTNKRVRLMVDNLPLVHSIQRGHSSSFVANGILADLFTVAQGAELCIECMWVPTDEQKADQYTRGSSSEHYVRIPP
eukprot:TRINITY_DN1082_c0_g2_i1.p1 TRINITY_DN1082_c0_g2~~TRINITY_DN1082_c0_g2_i1.p1  ORF type:complete len:471 (-),score=53.75 TRINITY_DN1082_c0_g2_i1:216-1628(-)